MKILVLGLLILTSTVALADGEGTICYDKGNAFVIDSPKGWMADATKAKELGLCVIYYVEGTTFDSSPAVIYPRLLSSRGQGQKEIGRIVAYNTNLLKKRGASELKVLTQPDLKTKKGLTFLIRHFVNGPSPVEFEAVAYHSTQHAILLSVLSTRSAEALKMYQPDFEQFLNGIVRLQKKP